MPSFGSQQHTFPDVPPSVSAGGHEMRDYYAGQDAPRPTTNQAPYLTPYLGLQARLSQIWINRWTILLLLVLVRTLIACASLDDNLGSARREALSACASVESMGSTMASMPHYMSQGVNELAADGVERAVNGLMSMVSLTITGVEEIVLFVINLLTSTYVCLITLAVSGSLHVALNVISDATDFLNNALGEIGDGIQSTVDGFQDSLNDFVDALNSVPEIFGGDGDIPTLDISDDLSKLDNLKIPASLAQGLAEFNKSIPNFEQVHAFTDKAIRFPFEKLKGLVNDEMGTFKFDRSLFPVPAREELSFCSDDNGINDFFDGLVDVERNAKKIFIGVVIALAILVCIPMAYQEIRRWRLMKERAALVHQQAFDSMDVIYIASRPYTATAGIKVADRFESVRRRTLVRWCVAYATSTPALFVLSLGFAGLFACLCQYILLRMIEKEVPELTAQVADFAEKVVFQLNNASEAWAVGTNRAINQTNADLNDKLFGWVDTSTTAVNGTLNTFVDEMTGALKDVFGGTILLDPVLEVVNCLITLKIEGIEKGLTWVHDHAHIDLPTLREDVFSLGAVASIKNESATDSFLASPSTAASDEISGVVDSLVGALAEGIRQEAIISLCVVLVWVIIALIGFLRTVVLLCGRGKGRAEGGQAYADDPATDAYRGHDDAVPRPMSVAPPYEAATRAAPYTVTPRRFPAPDIAPVIVEPDPTNEKVGSVGAHAVGGAVTRPAHLRASSHGALGGATPRIDEKCADQFPVEYHR